MGWAGPAYGLNIKVHNLIQKTHGLYLTYYSIESGLIVPDYKFVFRKPDPIDVSSSCKSFLIWAIVES